MKCVPAITTTFIRTTGQGDEGGSCVQSWATKFVLGCVISPLRQQPESRNLGHIFWSTLHMLLLVYSVKVRGGRSKNHAHVSYKVWRLNVNAQVGRLNYLLAAKPKSL